MDEQQGERIRDDLKGVVKGELLFDDLSRTLYSTDASIFQVQPLGVAVPYDEEDVQAIVRYAGEHHIALIPRGAGTGVAGESLGPGLVLDLSRHFRSILDIGSDWVRVQPGVVYQELNARLAREGRRFAPDPASGSQCTIGGMLATNASGSHALRHGYTRDHVTALRVVLDTGDTAQVTREVHWSDASHPGHLHDITFALAALLKKHGSLIQACQPRTLFNRCGYQVNGVLGRGFVDLTRLLIGSEGTLAIFTEAILQTIPSPASRGVVLIGFASLDAAVHAAQLCVSFEPAACELIDRRLLTLARGNDSDAASLVPAGAEAVLLVEFESDTPDGAEKAAAAMVKQLDKNENQVVCTQTAFDTENMDRLWSLREAVLPSLYGLRGGAHPIAFIEDVGVPVEELGGFLRQVQDILQKHETTASFLVHAGAGQVHTRPFLDLRHQDDIARLWAIADEVHHLAIDLGGTISTQHGTGLARTPWVERQYGRLYPVLAEIKKIFDPRGLFNPGKIIGPPAVNPVWPLRKQPNIPAETNHRLLKWQPGEVQAECSRCNGCGQCRTSSPQQRMCPIFRVTHEEAATPRAKANLIRHLFTGETDPRLLSSDDVRAVADLCVNCKMCGLECPAHVNIPKLMLEAKAANVAEHGLNRSDWVMARTESFAAFGSAFSFLVNLALANGPTRWLLEKGFGVSRKRRLPTFARRSFLQQAARRGWTKPPRSSRPRVAYFIDVYANYNDPEIAEAAVAVLHHNGIEVYVPPGQVGCGMAPLAQGDIETAKEVAQKNLRLLAELAREGYPIVCSEPTAALMLRQDYLDILNDPDAALVSSRTVELTTFLWDLHQQGRLSTAFQELKITIGHHVPCHLKALGKTPKGPALLALIPGMHVHTIDVNCSGMAGTFGLKAENYAVSLEAGKAMFREMGRPGILFGSTECSTCRMQMEDGGHKRTLHPVQYLALAYGLMPELSLRLREPIRELVLR